MRQKIEMAVLVVALIVVGITPCLVVAQVSLEESRSNGNCETHARVEPRAIE